MCVLYLLIMLNLPLLGLREKGGRRKRSDLRTSHGVVHGRPQSRPRVVALRVVLVPRHPGAGTRPGVGRRRPHPQGWCVVAPVDVGHHTHTRTLPEPVRSFGTVITRHRGSSPLLSVLDGLVPRVTLFDLTYLA